jgi:hypothetical protein
MADEVRFVRPEAPTPPPLRHQQRNSLVTTHFVTPSEDFLRRSRSVAATRGTNFGYGGMDIGGTANGAQLCDGLVVPRDDDVLASFRHGNKFGKSPLGIADIHNDRH